MYCQAACMLCELTFTNTVVALVHAILVDNYDASTAVTANRSKQACLKSQRRPLCFAGPGPSSVLYTTYDTQNRAPVHRLKQNFRLSHHFHLDLHRCAQLMFQNSL